jgi:epoxyqueuosine reductase
MKDSIATAFSNGEKVALIPVHRLRDVRSEVEQFEKGETLNGFQKYIVDGLYRFDIPSSDCPIHSIILVAVPHPFYAHVEFSKGGEKHRFLSLVRSDFDRAERDLSAFAASISRRIVPAVNIPLKRLAARSGMATYGRNNICYIEGMGSSFSLVAYFSDIVCGDGPWTAIRVAPEARMLLEGAPLEQFSPDFRQKAERLGMHEWFAAIPKNLRALLGAGPTNKGRE